MELEVLFLGTSGAVPTPERGLSATLIKRGGDRLLVDCGEGTQRQLMRAGVGINQISAILLTHMHADHYLGLPGLLKTWDLWGRTEPVAIYGPKGVSSIMALLQRIIGKTDFEYTTHEVPPDTVIARDDFHLKSLRTDHKVASIGWALVEDDRPGRFDVDTAKALGVKPGPDFGKLQRGETVEGANGPVTPDMVLEASRDADVLVHDSTFTLEAADRAKDTYHSTSTEAAELAKEAGVRMLALTHISFRHAPREVLAEARQVIPNVVLPHDLDRIEVPFGERGAPVFVDARAERAAARRNEGAQSS